MPKSKFIRDVAAISADPRKKTRRVYISVELDDLESWKSFDLEKLLHVAQEVLRKAA